MWKGQRGRGFDCRMRNRPWVRRADCFLARQPSPRHSSADNAREEKRTIARKHGHLRVLLLSASESERGFGSVFHHHYSKSQPLSVGIFFACSPSENRNHVARVASAAARFPAQFPQISLSLLSVGTRALATPLRLFSMTYRQQVRQVIWSGGGESGKGLAPYAKIHAGFLRALPHAPENPRSPKLLQF